MDYTYEQPSTTGTILCCLCGVSIQPNPTNMCINCISSQVDVTEGIQKEVSILYCKSCGRYLQPPKHWVKAELESRELLAYCVKRIKGLQKVKLIDAEFIWTEPHSKRIKLRLTVQREFNGAIVEGSFVVEFIVSWHMCTECNRQQTNNEVWTACVQVRQHIEHKRTFFYLEQLILKHKAHENAINMRQVHQGVDFYYGNRAHAVKFVDFLQSVVPIKHRNDKQLVSHDVKSNTYKHKYTFSVEIVPVCKEDLICLPPKVSSSYGGLGPIVLCLRVTNAVQLLDVNALRYIYMDASIYWRFGFKAMMSSRQLTNYVVLDIETSGERNGKLSMAEATVARESDFGVSDRTFHTKTHLGHILRPGDIALGYDLAFANLSSDDLEHFMNRGYQPPDVILVRKSYEDKRKSRKSKGVSRPWKLQTLDMDEGEGRRNLAEEDQQRERFLEELEEDSEMRSRIALYKNANAPAQQNVPKDENAMSEDDDSEGECQIPMEELLDELALVE